MLLIGSTASPFVRRIRILFPEISVEFIDVFSDTGQSRLKSLGPIRKVPVLIDGDKKVFDSNIIYQYLTNKPRDIEEQIDLLLVNEVNDSALVLLQLKRFGLDVDLSSQIAMNHQKRVEDNLLVINNYDLKWNFVGVSLFCLLDWLKFR